MNETTIILTVIILCVGLFGLVLIRMRDNTDRK